MPKNRMIVAGVDLYERFGLVMSDEYELKPPECIQEYIEVPFRMDGPLDLSEAGGYPSYSTREQSFVFGVMDPSCFEDVKTRVMNFLHNKRFDYSLSLDLGYTYTGRFSVDEYYSKVKVGYIKIKVVAEPYKLKETCTYRVNAAGGIVATLESGRMPVCPTFEFASETIVASGDVYVQMQPGIYKVNDLWLHEGANELYLNSYLGNGNVAAEKYADAVIADYADNRISDLIWEGVRSGAVIASDWALDTVWMHKDTRIVDAEFGVDGDSERYAVYIQYDWKDL